MDFKANYPLVGAFVILLGLVGITLGLWLGSTGGGKYYEKYMTYMDESVFGLAENTPVKFNGVDVGFVRTIRLNPKNYRQVVLVMDIDEEIPITETTVATLKSQGITGLTYIGLEVEMPNAPLLKKKEGEAYPVIKSSPSFLLRLDAMLQETSASIKKLAASMQEVFDEGNRNALKKSLLHIEKITKTFSQNSQKIDRTRQIEVVFLSHTQGKLDWQFYPVQKKITLNPGENKRIAYFAENNTDQTMTIQAIPSVTPGRAAKYLKKTECFCFTQQTLKGKTGMNMPILFHIDKDLPTDIHEIVLSYTLFDITHRKTQVSNTELRRIK